MSYKREIHPFFQRLKAIWYIISTRNFILVRVEETNVDGKKGRKVSPLYRTDYDGDSDTLTLTGALDMCKKRNENE